MSLFNKLLQKDQSEVLPGNTNNQQQDKPADFFFCLNIRKYFEIEEEQIKQRMVSAIILRPAFRQVIQDKPDLYGPFWIATTLIVIIIASASLITFFASSDGKEVSYEFTQIPVAASLIYGICFGAPYLIAIMVRIFGGSVSVVEVICVYGYSMSIFLPITAVCFIKLAFVHIILLTIGYFLSSLFLIRGILSMDRKLGDKEKMVLGVFILGVQLILVLMYKFYFFNLY